MKYSNEELYHYIRPAVEEFYELVYNDPWFSKLFRNIDQEIINNQQTDFMVQNFGGPKKFCGRSPKDAHPQIWIDEEIWDYREKLLKQAFAKLKTPLDIQEKWLKIDEAFKAVIINKGGPSECFGRYKSDEIIIEPKPGSFKKVA